MLACSLGAPVFADPAATQMINDLRKDKRRKALSYLVSLEKVAAAHANEMAAKGYFGHTGANGSSVGDRTTARGYKWYFVTENIAQGQRSLDAAMAAWTTSKGYYKNMMQKKAGEFGFARGDGNTWVMILAKPC